MKEVREGPRVGCWIWVGLCADECTARILVRVYMSKMKKVGGKINDIRFKRACNQEGFETYIRLTKAVCRTVYTPDFWCRTKRKVCYISKSTYISEILRIIIVTCGCQWSFLFFLAAADCRLNICNVRSCTHEYFGFPRRNDELIGSVVNSPVSTELDWIAKLGSCMQH